MQVVSSEGQTTRSDEGRSAFEEVAQQAFHGGEGLPEKQALDAIGGGDSDCGQR